MGLPNIAKGLGWLFVLATMVAVSMFRQASLLDSSLMELTATDWGNMVLVAVEDGVVSAVEEGIMPISGRVASFLNDTSKNSNICFFGDTRFFLTTTSTEVYAKELLTFLGMVALRSINEALSDGLIYVMIPLYNVKSPHFSHWRQVEQFMKPMVEKYDRLVVDFSPRSYKNMANWFEKTTCEWVVSVKLDADDVLAPGYLDWIVKKVIPTVDRGALVATRRLPRLNYGFHRCDTEINSGLNGILGKPETCPYWSGWAVGQTRIFRRNVFDSLGRPFQSDAHALALTIMRKAVYNEILKETPPWYLRENFQHAKRWHMFRRSDAIMEKTTGIKMVDSVEAGFGPSGIYVRTPLSSHFPFGKTPTLAPCTKKKWTETVARVTAKNVVKGKYDYLYEWGKTSNLTYYDLCKSSKIFRMESHWRGEFGTRQCEKVDREFKKKLSKAIAAEKQREVKTRKSEVSLPKVSSQTQQSQSKGSLLRNVSTVHKPSKSEVSQTQYVLAKTTSSSLPLTSMPTPTTLMFQKSVYRADPWNMFRAFMSRARNATNFQH